jgi:hypothetical protein
MSNYADRKPVCVARTRLTSLAAATGLTVPSGFNSLNQFELVEIQPRSQNIYYTVDGSTPTSTVGRDGFIGDVIPIEDPANLKIIEAAASASVEVWFYIRQGTT